MVHINKEKIEVIPIDSYMNLVINYDPRFHRVRIEYTIGEANEDNIYKAKRIVNYLGGEIYISKLEGTVKISVPVRMDIYRTLMDEIRDIYNMLY